MFHKTYLVEIFVYLFVFDPCLKTLISCLQQSKLQELQIQENSIKVLGSKTHRFSL